MLDWRLTPTLNEALTFLIGAHGLQAVWDSANARSPRGLNEVMKRRTNKERALENASRQCVDRFGKYQVIQTLCELVRRVEQPRAGSQEPWLST